MELKRIRELAKLLNTMGLEELSLEEASGEKLTLRRPMPLPVFPPPSAPAAEAAAAPEIQGLPVDPIVPTEAETKTEAEAEEKSKDIFEVVAVPSPLVGVFYAAPSPGAPPFVTVGQKVKAGDVLCVIEAMELMNQIVAEQDGIVIACCLENGQLVKFGQPLFQVMCT